MKRCIAILLSLLLLSACGTGGQAPAQAPESSPPPISESVPSSASPEPSPAESLPSDADGSQPSEPQAETQRPAPLSISLSQELPSGYRLWELRIEDEEELALVEGLLSTEGLTPSSAEEAMWPDGGSGIDFEIDYGDDPVTGTCNPQYNGGIFDDGYTKLRTHEDGIFYNYPREIGDRLLGFLESKGITPD